MRTTDRPLLPIETALITGGSRGLGLALAETLGERGVRVALVARDPAPLESAVLGLRARGIDAHAIAEDVGEKAAIHRIAGSAAALVGPIDLLIHCASTLGPTPLRALFDTECEDFERVLAVNLLGPFRLTKVIAGSMALRGRGVVVNISSDAATAAYPNWGSYGVSKAALDHLTRIWAAELEASGVRVLSVDPGEMRTQMHADAMPEADPLELADPVDVARVIAAIATSEGARSGARIIASHVEVAA